MSDNWNALFPYLFYTVSGLDCATGYEVIDVKFLSLCVQVVYCEEARILANSKTCQEREGFTSLSMWDYGNMV